MPAFLRPGRVQLDTRKITRTRRAKVISHGQLCSAVAILGVARGMQLTPGHESEKLRQAGRASRPLIASEKRAELLALVLDVPLGDLVR